MRYLYRARGRRSRPLVLDAADRARGARGRDGGRDVAPKYAPSSADRVRRNRSGSVRLLYARNPSGSEVFPRPESSTEPFRDTGSTGRESLPLHRLPSDSASGGAGGGADVQGAWVFRRVGGGGYQNRRQAKGDGAFRAETRKRTDAPYHWPAPSQSGCHGEGGRGD